MFTVCTRCYKAKNRQVTHSVYLFADFILLWKKSGIPKPNIIDFLNEDIMCWFGLEVDDLGIIQTSSE